MIKKLLRDSTLWVALFSVAASLLGFVREQAVAAKLGLSLQTDALYTAIAIVAVFPSFLSNAMAYVIAPHHAKIVNTENIAAGDIYLGRLLGLAVGISVIGTLLLVIGSWSVVPLLNDRNLAKLELVAGLTSLLALTLPLTVLCAGAIAALNVKECYSLGSLSALLLPAGAAFGVWLLPASAWSVVISVLLSSATQTGWLLYALQKKDIRLSFSWNLSWAKSFLVDLGHSVTGGLALGISTIYVQAIAASSGASEMASFNFGTKVTNAILGIAGAFLGTFLGPLLAKRAQGLTYSRLRLNFYVGATALGAVVTTLFLFEYSGPVIQALLKRGAFSEKDVLVVSHIQSLAALQIPFYLFSFVVCRELLAQHRVKLVSRLNWVYAFCIVTTGTFFKSSYGVGGLLLANGLGYAAIGGLGLYFILENQNEKTVNRNT